MIPVLQRCGMFDWCVYCMTPRVFSVCAFLVLFFCVRRILCRLANTHFLWVGSICIGSCWFARRFPIHMRVCWEVCSVVSCCIAFLSVFVLVALCCPPLSFETFEMFGLEFRPQLSFQGASVICSSVRVMEKERGRLAGDFVCMCVDSTAQVCVAIFYFETSALMLMREASSNQRKLR